MSDSETQPSEPEAPPTPPKGSGLRTWLIAGAAAAAAAIIAIVAMTLIGHSSSKDDSTTASTQNDPAAAGATRGRFGPRGMGQNGVSGTVSAIDGNTITVRAEQFGTGGSGSGDTPKTITYTVTTSNATKVTESVAGSLSDLAAGDTVIVSGAESNGTIDAARIAQVDSSRFGRGGQSGPGTGPGSGPGSGRFGNEQEPNTITFGKVRSVSGDTMVIDGASGNTLTVMTTSQTPVMITKKLELSSLKVGDRIRATGTVSGKHVAATAIVIGSPDGFGFGGGGGPGGFGGHFRPGSPTRDGETTTSGVTS